jgi:xylulokinase
MTAAPSSACLGIELSPDAVRCVIFGGPGSKEVSALATLTNDESREPEAWWRALAAALADLALAGGDPSRVSAISVTGTPYGAVFLGGDGKVLAPAVLAGDREGAVWCDWLETTARRSRSINGNLAKPDMMGVALLFLRDRAPDVWAKLASVLSPKDYLVWRLTGEKTTDPSSASASLLFDPVQNCWAERILTPLGFPPEILPVLHNCDASVGTVQNNVGDEIGLARAPVMAGTCDLVAASLSLGLEYKGATLLSMKSQTSLTRLGRTFLPDPFRHIDVRSYCGSEMFYHLSEIGPCVGFDTWARSFADHNSAVQMEANRDHEAYFLPKLSHGAAMAGLTPKTTPQDIARAILHGVAFEVAESLNVLDELLPGKEDLHCLAPASVGAAWGSYLASAARRPLVFHEDDGFRTAAGAAHLALRGLEGQGGSPGRSEGAGNPAPHGVTTRIEPTAELTAHFDIIQPKLSALKTRLTL